MVALETARRLESLPATDEALRRGTLSLAKVNEIASTAGDRPEKESELVAAAKCETLPALQERCRALRAEGRAGVEGYEKVRKSRFLRHWTDAEGAFRLEARLCPDAGAKVLAALEPHHRRIFAHARREGRRESYEAYAADALVALADGDGSGPRGMVHARADHSALVRGFVEEGEVCDIPGIGPIPVAVARELAEDGILKVILTKGVDVVAVAHGGRTIPAHVRSALETRDPKCVVPGCDVRDRLEIDHLVSFCRGRTDHAGEPGPALPPPPRPQDPPGLGPRRPPRRLDVGPTAGATTVSATDGWGKPGASATHGPTATASDTGTGLVPAGRPRPGLRSAATATSAYEREWSAGASAGGAQ